jgi:hypothetical protein
MSRILSVGRSRLDALHTHGTTSEQHFMTWVLQVCVPSASAICWLDERDSRRPANFFSEVLNRLLTPALVSAGFRVVTTDRRGSDVIHSTIVNPLLDADLVIADLTDHNPNVLFELGLRMHADKPIALIQAEGTARIFDVDNVLRVLTYNPNLWTSTVETDRPRLTEHVKAAWEDRESADTYMKLLRRKAPSPEE